MTLAHPGLRRAGFQLSARDDSLNMTGGSDAGSLSPTDGLVDIVQGDRLPVTTYLQHTEEGAATATPGAATWTLEWTAPEERVPVAFHIAANASNDDASPLGDFIYTALAGTR